MGTERLVGGCLLGLLLSAAAAGAAPPPSDVADAVMAGDAAALRTLLDRRADVNAPQADGATALQWAAYRDDMTAADLLVKAGADVKAANREGMTPLYLASINGSAEMIALLVKAGAEVNQPRARGGETALMFAARTGKTAAVQALLDHGADVNVKETLRGTTALMWAVVQGHPQVTELLVARGADVNARTNPDMNLSKPGVYARGTDPRPDRMEAALNAARGQGRIRTAAAGPRVNINTDGGGLSPLVFASRHNDIQSARVLLSAGANVNQLTAYDWSPLLVAIHNRNYQLASLLLDKGADPTIANKNGWTPLYIAIDNRNPEGGDYPVRQPDMDQLEFIKKLLDQGADKTVNTRMKTNTERRTVFRSQWVNEDGETVFMRAAESSDLVVMRLLLAKGADPLIPTRLNVTPLQVAAGIGWVDGMSYEWSEAANLEAVKLLLDLGADPNAQADTGRTALMGAAHKGRPAVIQLLIDHGARLETRDFGMLGEEAGGRLTEHTWQAVDYADGLIAVGTQSPVAQPAAGALLRKLMKEAGMYVPAYNRTIATVCITSVCE